MVAESRNGSKEVVDVFWKPSQYDVLTECEIQGNKRIKILNLSSYEEGVFNNSDREDNVCKALVYPPMRDYSIMPSNMFMSTNKICHLLWVCYIVDMFQTPFFNTHNILRLLGTKKLVLGHRTSEWQLSYKPNISLDTKQIPFPE